MIHKMKLQAKYFDFMHRGTKRLEIRLNDEKRQLIKIGDIIEFDVSIGSLTNQILRASRLKYILEERIKGKV